MSYISGEDRGQPALLPAAIQEHMAADAPSDERAGGFNEITSVFTGPQSAHS